MGAPHHPKLVQLDPSQETKTKHLPENKFSRKQSPVSTWNQETVACILLCTQLKPLHPTCSPPGATPDKPASPPQSLRVYRVSSGRQISPVRLLLMFPFCRLGTQETLWVWRWRYCVPLHSPGSSAQILAHPMPDLPCPRPASSDWKQDMGSWGPEKSLGGGVALGTRM